MELVKLQAENAAGMLVQCFNAQLIRRYPRVQGRLQIPDFDFAF